MNTEEIINKASEYFGTDVTQATKYKAPLWNAKCSLVRYLIVDKKLTYSELREPLKCTSNELWLLRVHGDNKMMIPAFRNTYNYFVNTLNH